MTCELFHLKVRNIKINLASRGVWFKLVKIFVFDYCLRKLILLENLILFFPVLKFKHKSFYYKLNCDSVFGPTLEVPPSTRSIKSRS